MLFEEIATNGTGPVLTVLPLKGGPHLLSLVTHSSDSVFRLAGSVLSVWVRWCFVSPGNAMGKNLELCTRENGQRRCVSKFKSETSQLCVVCMRKKETETNEREINHFSPELHHSVSC